MSDQANSVGVEVSLGEFGNICGKAHSYLPGSIDTATIEVIDAIYQIVTQVPKVNDVSFSPHFMPISTDAYHRKD